MVPPEVIDQIRQAVRLLDVVGEAVALRKSGRNHVGLCPFHIEKSPSFSVNASKNLYHCFGCQAGGDAFDFVMRQRGVDFAGAIELLGQRVGIDVTPTSPEKRRERALQARLTATNACALRFFCVALLHSCGAAARQALTERGAPAAQVKARRLGYGHTTAALLAYLKRAQITPEDAQAAGLLSEDGQRSLFEGRLIFPIVALHGDVVGFGGRSLRPDDRAPKYINSKETSIFSKRSLLYGLHEAHSAIRRHKQVVIMEGYTDVLTAARSGVDTAVAVLGTSFTPEHAKTLQRLCDGVVLCFDADRAGRQAARRSSLVALQAGLTARLADLPAGEDPDSLVRQQGAAALSMRLQKAQSSVEFFMNAAFAERQTMSIEQRSAAARELQPLLQALGSGLERELYTERLAQCVGVTVPQLLRALPRSRAAAPQKNPQKKAAEPEQRSPASGSVRAPAQGPLPYELELLRELLLFPALRARFGEIADYAISPAMQQLMEELASSQNPPQDILPRYVPAGPKLNTLLKVRAKAAEQATKNATADDFGGDEAASRHTFGAVLASFKRHRLDVALRELVAEIRQCEATGEATLRLMRRKQELTARKRALKQHMLPEGRAQPTPLAATDNVQGE